LRQLLAAVCLVSLLEGRGSTAGAAERYAALFEDGVRVEASELKDWNDPQSQPRLGDRLLWDASRPVCWVIDRQLEPSAVPAAFVEFTGGDRLAGEVIGFQMGNEWPFERWPAHLVVRPVSDLQPPDDPERGQVRVAVDFVQRVAWSHRPAERLRPGTVILHGGGEFAFRSVRWRPQGVVLLLDDGIKEIPFADLAEIHLPPRDPWQAYQDEVAVLGPEPNVRLVEWHTLDGGRYTASTARFQARHWGDKNRPESWLHLVQPAWSLDPLWIRFRTVHTIRSWAAVEPPLVRFGPQSVQREAVFSQGWNWQRDQSTRGKRLMIGEREFAGGFGVHASTDLHFDWPSFARGLRVVAGLDPAADSRGCVSLSIRLNDGVVFAREQLIGSREIVDTNWVSLPPADSARRQRLTLRADMAAAHRPAGTDPFDIRDMVTWGDPQVRLDVEALQPSGPRRLASIAGLAGWTATDADWSSLRTLNVCDVTDAREPRFRTVFRTVEPFVVLSHSLRVGPHDHWLSLMISRFSDHAASSVQVKLDGISRGEFAVPVRQGPVDPDPLLIPVADCRGRTVLLELVIYPTAENSWIDFRGLALTDNRPGIRPVYADDALVLEQLPRDGGHVEPSREQPFSGTHCLRVAPGPPAVLAPLPGGEAVIAELPKLGQFRYLAFAWRGENTAGLALHLGHEGRFGADIAEALGAGLAVGKPARRGGRQRRIEDRGLRHGYAYDAGIYQPLSTSPLRLDRQVPDQWKLETRDLFGDFGPILLTGVAVQCLERGVGWFDHIYLARTPQDLEYVRQWLVPEPPGKPDETYSQKATRSEEWGAAIAQFAPAFATREAPHGLYQKREHFGQSDGWQTHPIDQNQPFILRTGLVLPADRPQELDLRVSHAPQGDWRLVVRGNGQKIFETIVDEHLTRPQRGWASLQVDLSSFRGQKVLLEVLNESNDGKNDYGYWKRVVLRDLSPKN
jgi:hypothetical protein